MPNGLAGRACDYRQPVHLERDKDVYNHVLPINEFKVLDPVPAFTGAVYGDCPFYRADSNSDGFFINCMHSYLQSGCIRGSHHRFELGVTPDWLGGGSISIRGAEYSSAAVDCSVDEDLDAYNFQVRIRGLSCEVRGTAYLATLSSREPVLLIRQYAISRLVSVPEAAASLKTVRSI